MLVRSMGVCLGKTAWICGHMLPLKPLVSTVLSTTGTSKTLAAFESATLLLMIVWRSKFDTPKSICGWRSISVTTQLSGVNSPFSLRLLRALGCGMVVLLCVGHGYDWYVGRQPRQSRPGLPRQHQGTRHTRHVTALGLGDAPLVLARLA